MQVCPCSLAMNRLTDKLNCAAAEVLMYLERNGSNLAGYDHAWRELARHMTEAARLTDETEAEKAVGGIARRIIDEFPSAAEFSPTFLTVLDAIERARRKKRARSNG